MSLRLNGCKSLKTGPGWGGGDGAEQEIDGIPVTLSWSIISEDTGGIYVEVEICTKKQGWLSGTQRIGQAIRRLPSGEIFEVPENELISY